MPFYSKQQAEEQCTIAGRENIPSRSALFLHVPKTGGTALNKWLKEGYCHLPSFFAKYKHDEESSTPQHFSYDALKQKIDRDVFDSLFAFTVVRNPYERLESEFFYRLALKTINLGKASDTMFSPWVCDMLNKASKKPHLLDNHFAYQSSFTGSGVKVYKFEDGLYTIAKDLAHELGLAKPDANEFNNVSKRRPVLWSNEAIRAVNRFYADDFALFEYNQIQANTQENKLILFIYKKRYQVLTSLRDYKHAIRKR